MPTCIKSLHEFLGHLNSTDFRPTEISSELENSRRLVRELDAKFPGLVRAIGFLKTQGNKSAHPRNVPPTKLAIQFREHGDAESADCVAVRVSFLRISKRNVTNNFALLYRTVHPVDVVCCPRSKLKKMMCCRKVNSDLPI